MWQRFTERARRVILLAQEEAGKMNCSHVGTEHLLLGIVRENEGVAAQVLLQTGLSLALIQEEIEDEIDAIEESPSNEPKLTPRAKRVLELAADEARRMKHNYIGSEHLLLALIREKDGVAANVLRKLGLNLEKARQQVMEYLGPEVEHKTPPSNETFVVMENREVREKLQKERAKRLELLEWVLPMLPRLLPLELRDMGRELRSLHKQKEAAVLQEHYEAAALLRNQTYELEKRMEDFADEWATKMNEEEPLIASRESMAPAMARLITEIEAALEALSASDAEKIAEIKARLRSFKIELLEPTDQEQDSENAS